jgi:ribosomal protein L3 glutamine methyltransferase
LKEYTIQTLIDVVAEYFSKSDIYYGHGTDNAIDEAVYLVIAKLNISFDISQNDLQRSVRIKKSLFLIS